MGGSFVAVQDLTRWALGAPLPRSQHIGADRVGRVLVALVQYADSDGIAWPSAERLAADLSGITRWDVRNALDLLAEAGYITPVGAGGRGRARRWKVGPGDVAGIPANQSPQHLLRMPASHRPDEMAGNLAGDMAGDMAGIPAPNRTEERKPPTPTRDVAAVPRHETEQAEESAVHEFEPDARRALSALNLGLDEDKLLVAAYRLGHGNPWAGYKQVRHRTEHLDLTNVRNRSGYLWKVLEPEAPKPRDLHAPTGPAECKQHEGWPLPCKKCERIAKEQRQEDAA